MTPEQEERFVVAFERLADYAHRWLEIQYPPKREVTDATITHIKTDEEKILEDQGYDPSELGRWLDIGPRERAFEESTRSAGVRSGSQSRGTDKTRR